MSVFGQTFGFLAIKPKISISDGRLRARSCVLVQLLWLFSYCKRVIVNPHARKVSIETRYLFFLKKNLEISFDRIRAVGYGYRQTATSWMWTGETTDSFDTFKVMLVLVNPFERVHLFNFTGEGANFTGWRGVLLHGDSMVDYSGDQEDASASYVDMLKEIIGVPIESVR